MDTEEIKRDMVIDPNELDVAAACQAETFFKWAERLVQAKCHYENLDFAQDLLKAQLGMAVRENPEKFGLTKVTEGGVLAAVEQHADYKAAQDKRMAARAEVAMLEQAVGAMEQRKRMIETLCTLHGQQYFAGPSTPHDLVSAWNNHREKMGQRNVERTEVRKRVTK